MHPYFVDTGTQSVRRQKVTLTRNPKSLFVLWYDYEFGVGERRAAKTCSRKDYGKNRHVYSKRNIFLSLVVEMVRRCHSANSAIDKIYNAYGLKTSVTEILKKL